MFIPYESLSVPSAARSDESPLADIFILQTFGAINIACLIAPYGL
jgi:hypothetical protein